MVKEFQIQARFKRHDNYGKAVFILRADSEGKDDRDNHARMVDLNLKLRQLVDDENAYLPTYHNDKLVSFTVSNSNQFAKAVEHSVYELNLSVVSRGVGDGSKRYYLHCNKSRLVKAGDADLDIVDI